MNQSSQQSATSTSSLNVDRLENVEQHEGKITARCPACAERDRDSTGNHLVVYDSGRFTCVANIGDSEHQRRIFALAGTKRRSWIQGSLHSRDVELQVRRPVPPSMREPTIPELSRLAAQRKLGYFSGLRLAVGAGHLRFANLRDAGEIVPAWVLLDSSLRNLQARRVDGMPWRGINAKAKTLAGSQAGWPIGSADIGDKPFVALCEGGPDTLAAWTLVWHHRKSDEVAPVCMTGAGNKIHPEALPLFRGKGVYLFPHKDAAGEKAAAIWTNQLRQAGACWTELKDVGPHKDLNDQLAALAAQKPTTPMQ